MSKQHDFKCMTRLGICLVAAPWVLLQSISAGIIMLSSHGSNHIIFNRVSAYDLPYITCVPVVIVMICVGLVICRFPPLMDKCFTPAYLAREDSKPCYIECIKVPFVLAAIVGALAICHAYLTGYI